jgi:Chaperone of endosialidase
MADLLSFNETPNLLELVEAGAKASAFGDLSVCGDEGAGRLSLSELSLCGDEATDTVNLIGGENLQSVCADEPTSDVRLKTDIEQVGTTVYGLPLYRFRYRNGTERFEGVMAQDVLRVMPDAVTVDEDGYYRVKYAQLGIRMTRA